VDVNGDGLMSTSCIGRLEFKVKTNKHLKACHLLSRIGHAP
jgi:hypothetical protein